MEGFVKKNKERSDKKKEKVSKIPDLCKPQSDGLYDELKDFTLDESLIPAVGLNGSPIAVPDWSTPKGHVNAIPDKSANYYALQERILQAVQEHDWVKAVKEHLVLAEDWVKQGKASKWPQNKTITQEQLQAAKPRGLFAKIDLSGYARQARVIDLEDIVQRLQGHTTQVRCSNNITGTPKNPRTASQIKHDIGEGNRKTLCIRAFIVKPSWRTRLEGAPGGFCHRRNENSTHLARRLSTENSDPYGCLSSPHLCNQRKFKRTMLHSAYWKIVPCFACDAGEINVCALLIQCLLIYSFHSCIHALLHLLLFIHLWQMVSADV